MTNLDYLAQTLLHIRLRPGFDVDIQNYDDDTGVSISWHKPSINVAWYPIIQIDLRGKTIYHREGPESISLNYRWGAFLQDAADFLYDYQYDQLNEADEDDSPEWHDTCDQEQTDQPDYDPSLDWRGYAEEPEDYPEVEE